MYYSKGFNSIYMEFVGYGTYYKLIWKSGEGYRNTSAISKEGTQRINMNMTYTSANLGFWCSPHKYTCDILSENLF